MPYATVDDFLQHYQVAEYEDIGNLDNQSESQIDDRIANALQLAESEINQILARSYTLPLPVTASYPYLKWATIAIARKLLDSYEEREKTRADYEDVIKSLEKIVNGQLALLDAANKPVPVKPKPAENTNLIGNMYSGNRKAPRVNFGSRIYRIK